MISGLVKMETAFPLKRNVTEILIAMMDLMSLIAKRYVHIRCLMVQSIKLTQIVSTSEFHEY